MESSSACLFFPVPEQLCLGTKGNPPAAFAASGAGVVAEGFEEVMVLLEYREPVVHPFGVGFDRASGGRGGWPDPGGAFVATRVDLEREAHPFRP